MKIATVTLNAAIDQTVRVDNFRLNRVNRGQAIRFDASGKGVNVASFLADYGHDTAVTGYLGQSNVNIFEQFFAFKGIDDCFVRIPGNTRINVKVVDEVNQQTTDINMPGQTPPQEAMNTLFETIEQLASSCDWFVLSGSLPPHVPTAIYATIITQLKRQKKHIILDTSGEALREGIQAGPIIVKPNIEELQHLMRHSFVIISGGIDLSTGFVMGMASVAAALVMSGMGGSAPLFVVVLAGVVTGLGIGLIPGLVNGLIIARLRVPSFIVTLGMYGIARGAGFILSGGQPVSIQTNGIGQIGNAYLLYLLPDGRVSFFHLPSNLQGVRPSQIIQLLPVPLIFLVVVVLICVWLLWQTRFGRHTYAVGGSEEASRRAGIPVVRHTILIYVLSAFMASVAGVLYTLRFSNGAADVGDPLLLTSIAAVIIGGASLMGGEGTIVGTVIGALIIAIIQNGLIFLGINPFWQFIAVGAVIILAVLVDQAKKQLV